MTAPETPAARTTEGRTPGSGASHVTSRAFWVCWLAVTSCAVTAHQIHLLNP